MRRSKGWRRSWKMLVERVDVIILINRLIWRPFAILRYISWQRTIWLPTERLQSHYRQFRYKLLIIQALPCIIIILIQANWRASQRNSNLLSWRACLSLNVLMVSRLRKLAAPLVVMVNSLRFMNMFCLISVMWRVVLLLILKCRASQFLQAII